MKIISAEEVDEALSFPQLVNDLRAAYGASFTMPQRQVFLLDENNHDNVVLVVGDDKQHRLHNRHRNGRV